MPQISAIVPVYNAERHLASCLDALIGQRFPRQDYEIIVVDNNSTDSSAEIVRRYDGVRFFHQPVQGSYAARNLGICQARGDVIATIDPDCCPAPHWLECIASAMEDPECGILLGGRHYANGSRALSLLAAYEAEKMSYVIQRKTPELYYGYTNNMAIRRVVFDRVGLFPERARGADTMFVRRAVDALGCGVVRFCRKMEVWHLEIDTLQAYYRKRVIYGQSNERIAQTMPYRPLSNRERWRVFTQAVGRNDLPVARALMMLGLLVPGAILYEWGRRRAL